MENIGIQSILPFLDDRNWLKIRSNNDSGPFITTDNPVNLTWNEPEKVPFFIRKSPGFGMKDTRVYFPISKSLAIVGEFDGPDGVIDGTRELVAAFNSGMLMYSYKQVYAPNIGFYYLGKDGNILEGNRILNEIST